MDVEVIRGRVGSLPPGWTPPNPLGGSDLPAQPLPPGANVGTSVKVQANGWNMQDFAQSMAVADQAAQAIGVDLFPKIDVQKSLAAVIGGVGAAGLLGITNPVGIALMAALFLVAALQRLGVFGGGGTYSNAGPGVHQWSTAYAPSEFVDWVKEQADGKVPFQTIPQMSAALLEYWLAKYGAVITADDQPWYSGKPDAAYLKALAPAAVPSLPPQVMNQAHFMAAEQGDMNAGRAIAAELYAKFAVQYAATRELRQAEIASSGAARRQRLVVQERATVSNANIPPVDTTVGDGPALEPPAGYGWQGAGLALGGAALAAVLLRGRRSSAR